MHKGKTKVLFIALFICYSYLFLLPQMLGQIPSTTPPDISERVKVVDYFSITSGADRIDEWLPEIAEKSVGVVVNQTSILAGNIHLVDALIERKVKLRKIFAPEHGFRSIADAGEKIEDSVDAETGIPIISLYGTHRKPTREDFSGLDVVIFDIQDVGVRFYTYISTLEYVMEACNEYDVKCIILDRPNPNGFYVAGPRLELKFQSFVGRQNVPIVYGLTIGEYARMLVGENWVEHEDLDYKIIPCLGYDHDMTFDLPVKPSPNLPTHRSVLLYPSLCFFEGTVISAGRGTAHPFEIYGHPLFMNKGFTYTFTPIAMDGARYPKLEGELCYGMTYGETSLDRIINGHLFSVDILCKAYEAWDGKASFFLENNFIDLLAGTDKLRKALIAGSSAREIEDSWTEDLKDYKLLRERYLLY